MHGIFHFLDQKMSDSAIEAERRLLSEDFGRLLAARKENPLADDSGPPLSGALDTVSESVHSGNVVNALLKFMMASMEEIGEPANPENDDLPAGYTYFGQFLAHDLSAHRFIGNTAPALRARSLYGMGPGAAPYIYQYKPLQKAGLRFRGVKFSMDAYETTFGATVKDVPRYGATPDKFAPERLHTIPLMADGRNDQNFIISQLTVAFMQLHNFIVDAYYDPSLPQSQGALFNKASTAFVGLYQALILHDYLPRMLYDPLLIEKLIADTDHNFVFYSGKKGGVNLSEIFSRAAFRYGHAQVRQIYKTFSRREPLTIFAETGEDLRGFVRDSRRALDLDLFFGMKEGKAIQAAKSITHRISRPLNDLPFLLDKNNNLALLNLQQSISNFPGGAAFYQILENISKDAARAGKLTDKEKQALNGDWTLNNLAKEIEKIVGGNLANDQISFLPLWLFLLLESETIAKGKKLGPLGSRIIAEQIIWALKDDPESILNKPENFPKDLFSDKKVNLADVLRVITPVASIDIDQQVLETVDPGYYGNELRMLDEATFKPYTDRAESLIERTKALNNGFYDIDTPRDQDYVELLRTNQYKEPGKAKQQIRVYVSCKSILYHLGFPVENPEWTERIRNKDIKGLLFIFGLANENIEFVVKRIGIDGKVPTNVIDKWYATHIKYVIMPDGSCLDEALEPVAGTVLYQNDVYAELAGAFIKDGFGILKNNGMPANISITRKVLLDLLSESDSDLPSKADTVSVLLCLTKGSDILDTHRLWGALPEGEPQETVPDAYFFSLGLRSTLDDNTMLYSEDNRSYPYWCYLA